MKAKERIKIPDLAVERPTQSWPDAFYRSFRALMWLLAYGFTLGALLHACGLP